MPTPLDVLLDPVTLLILAMYFLLMLWEAFFPGRELPAIRFWKIKGIIFFLIYFYIATYLPLLYAAYLPSTQLINGQVFGDVGGGGVRRALIRVRCIYMASSHASKR